MKKTIITPEESMDTKMSIIEQEEFGVTKTVDDYLKDPKIKNRLSEHDIKDLRIWEESIKKSIILKKKLKQDLGLSYNVENLLDMPVEDYKRAVPYVLDWLHEYTDWRDKEGIIRSLSTPYAKPQAYKTFIREFQSTSDETDHSLKWAIGNGLYVFAEDDIVDELIPLVEDRKHGGARQMIVLGLGKMKNPVNKERVTDVLIKLLADEDVAGHAIEALGKLEAKRARPYVESFLNHKKTWWRNAAKSAIKKMTKHSN